MLQQALRQRVFELVDSVRPEARYKVLILDEKAKRLIDQVLERHELLDREVANVASLTEPRQTEAYLDAIYIVEQCSFSFGCISADFTRMPRRYKRAHVFLLPSLRSSDSERQRFETSSISRHLAQVTDAPIDFLALEAQTFSLGLESANHLLYNAACRDSALKCVDLTARRLAFVCEALGVRPFVRFSALWQRTRVNAFPALVARAAVSYIDAARSRYMTPAREALPRPTLLVLDRSIDLTAPFLTDFHFQALALDTLASQWTPPDVLQTFASKDGSTTGTVTEKDAVWTDLRHRHIVVVTEALNTRIRDLKTANPHFADPASDVSVGDVRNMLAALPEFMRERDNVTLSLEIALECMDAVESGYLKQRAEFEQACALGTTIEGDTSPHVQLTESLITILAQKDLDAPAKVRALALYALYRHGLFATDFMKIQHHSRLRDDDMSIVQALSYLGYPVVKEGAATPEKVPRSLVREAPDQPLLYARVQPAVQTVAEALAKGELDETAFPYAGDAPDSEQEALNKATSLRNPRQRATWAQNVNTGPGSISAGGGGGNGNAHERPKRQTLVFVVGGFTPSEAAAAYAASEATGNMVLLGGHSILTPQKYLDFLERITWPREKLALPEDAPEPKVPDFLSASDRQNKKAPPMATTGVPAGALSSGSAGQAPAEARKQGQASSYGQSLPSSSQQQQRSQTPGQTNLELAKNAQSVSQTLGTMSLGTEAPKKEKKDMKHRLKGAFKIKR